MRVRKPDDEPFEINLIPMIDCMLVIIIFFLVATTLKDKKKDGDKPRPELAVILPDSLSAASKDSPPDAFVIGLDATGRVFLAGDSTPADNAGLHREIRRVARAEGPDHEIRIEADRGARYEDVVRILDLCAFEGLRHVGFHTKAESAP